MALTKSDARTRARRRTRDTVATYEVSDALLDSYLDTALKDVAAKRQARGIPLNAPLSLAKVIVVTRLDEHFADFAQRVGGRSAETFFLRAIQVAADSHGSSGAISVPRHLFGQLVLSRSWDLVSRKTGEVVYDALLASSICIPSADSSADSSADMPAPSSADRSALPSADVSTFCLRPPSPSPSPSVFPPTPPRQGGADLSADEPLPTHAGNGRPTRADRKAAETVRLAEARNPERLANAAKNLPPGVALHGGFLPTPEPPADAANPADAAKRVLAQLRKPSPENA